MNQREAEFLSRAIYAAHDAGLLAHHAIHRCPGCGLVQPTGDPGFPDLVIAGPRGLLIRELKSRTGIMQPAQKRWARHLALGFIGTQPGREPVALYDLWREPIDWVSGRAEHEMKAIA